MKLPTHSNLPIHLLQDCLKHTTSSYKYFWLYSLTNLVEQDFIKIQKKDLFAEMISSAWGLSDLNLSYGKYDLMEDIIQKIKQSFSLHMESTKKEVFLTISTSFSPKIEDTIWILDRYVPYLFLSPWFPRLFEESDKEKEIRTKMLSQQFFNQSLYALYDEYIEINPEWSVYIKTHASIIRRFCMYHFSTFLLKKNPMKIISLSQLESGMI